MRQFRENNFCSEKSSKGLVFKKSSGDLLKISLVSRMCVLPDESKRTKTEKFFKTTKGDLAKQKKERKNESKYFSHHRNLQRHCRRDQDGGRAGCRWELLQ